MVTSTDGAYVEVFMAQTDGTFQRSATLVAGFNPRKVAVSDQNGDGKLDLISTTLDNVLSIHTGNGDGTFSSSISTQDMSLFPRDIDVGDFNRDGVNDLAVSVQGSDGVSIYVGNQAADGRQSNYMYALDLTSIGGARQTLESLRTKLNQISTQLGSIGAAQSRLSSASSTLRTRVENFQAARSRIMDVDVATESAELTRASIVRQVSSSVLAQANVQPSLAIDLLRT